MPIHNVFSKRHSKVSGELIKNQIPFALKNQVMHIWEDFFAQTRIKKDTRTKAWVQIYKSICREHGLGKLIYDYVKVSKLPYDQFNMYYQSISGNEVSKLLDIVELIFRVIKKVDAFQAKNNFTALKIRYEHCVNDLNMRFVENNVAFKFENSQVLRIDSEYNHAEIIKPVIELLSDKRFKNANTEYMEAHSHFRQGSYEPCIVECAKAFESTLKIICETLKWQYDQNDTALPLIRAVTNSGLVPKYLENSMVTIGTIRNKSAAHGKGVVEVQADENLARYALTETASVVYYLMQAFHSYQASAAKQI